MMEHEVKTKTLFQNVSFKWQRRNSLQSALIDLILVRKYDGYRLESVNLNMAPPWDDPLHVDENVLFKSFFVYLCKTVLKIKYFKSRNYLFLLRGRNGLSFTLNLLNLKTKNVYSPFQ